MLVPYIPGMPRELDRRSSLHTWAMIGALTVVLALLGVVLVGGNSESSDGRSLADALLPRRRLDAPPMMLNHEPPFRYPAVLYAQKVQGNVTLRIFIDRDGRVRPESTRVEESSGYGSLDSSAVVGSQELQFTPARLNGEPIAMSVLFPVFFRHPEASPLPEDTALKKHH
jgi:TonB family protein